LGYINHLKFKDARYNQI